MKRVLAGFAAFLIANSALAAGYPGGNQINAAGSGATLSAAPGNLTATTSLTGTMGGAGGLGCTFTPTYSGRVMVSWIGFAQNNTASDRGSITPSWGLGTAPSNGDALTITAGSFVVGHQYKIATVGTTDFTTIGSANNNVGTLFIATGVGSGTGTATQGTQAAQSFPVVINNGSTSALAFPFSVSWPMTGLTVGSAYWLDVVQTAITGGTLTVNNVKCVAYEF